MPDEAVPVMVAAQHVWTIQELLTGDTKEQLLYGLQKALAEADETAESFQGTGKKLDSITITLRVDQVLV